MTGESLLIRGWNRRAGGIAESGQEDSGISRLQKRTVLCRAKETLIDG